MNFLWGGGGPPPPGAQVGGRGPTPPCNPPMPILNIYWIQNTGWWSKSWLSWDGFDLFKDNSNGVY